MITDLMMIILEIWGSCLLRASSLGCAREGGVGTEVRNVGKIRQDSPKLAKFRCRRDRGFYLGIPSAGTPKYWFLDKGIWAKKHPITRPIDCHLDCERRRYFEKIANTLTFWRQKKQKPMNSYGFSYILRPELGFVRGSAPGEGPGQLPEPPPDLPESK